MRVESSGIFMPIDLYHYRYLSICMIISTVKFFFFNKLIIIFEKNNIHSCFVILVIRVFLCKS